MSNHTARLCFYRYIPCFLHLETDEEPMLIGMNWYAETILNVLIWLDFKVFKNYNPPIEITNFVLNL